MSQLLEKLAAETRQLSRDERLELVEILLAELHGADPEWQAAWVRECEDRAAAVASGEMQTKDFAEVMVQARARLRQG